MKGNCIHIVSLGMLAQMTSSLYGNVESVIANDNVVYVCLYVVKMCAWIRY